MLTNYLENSNSSYTSLPSPGAEGLLGWVGPLVVCYPRGGSMAVQVTQGRGRGGTWRGTLTNRVSSCNLLQSLFSLFPSEARQRPPLEGIHALPGSPGRVTCGVLVLLLHRRRRLVKLSRLFGLRSSLPCFTLRQFNFISLCIVTLACFSFPWLPAARRQTRVPRLWLHQYYLVLY